MNKALKRFSRLARLRILHTTVLAAVMAALFPSPTHAAGWITKSEGVLEQAETSKKLVVYAFLGNGWDNASMNMKQKILRQGKFLSALDKHYILVELSVPIVSEQASEEVKDLMEKYEVSIFPALIVVNSKGKELEEIRYMLKPMSWYLRKFDRLASRHLPKK